MHFPLPFAPSTSYHLSVFRPRCLLFACWFSLVGLGTSFDASADEPPNVERVVVNRIIAVVDRDVITLVELKRRAEPFQKSLAGIAPDKRAAAEAQLHKDLIQQAIDERLIARDARALRVVIASSEIDAALDAIAKAKSVTREKLLQLAAEQGFSEALYREQLVKQLLVGKLIRIRMHEQLSKVDKDPEKSSKQIEMIEKAYLQGLRANVFIEVRS